MNFLKQQSWKIRCEKKVVISVWKERIAASTKGNKFLGLTFKDCVSTLTDSGGVVPGYYRVFQIISAFLKAHDFYSRWLKQQNSSPMFLEWLTFLVQSFWNFVNSGKVIETFYITILIITLRFLSSQKKMGK